MPRLGCRALLTIFGLLSAAHLVRGAEKPESVPDEGPWKATLPYFAPDLVHTQTLNEKEIADLTEKIRSRFHLTGPCNCRVLIATVPDPVNSRLGLFFDRSMESIQRAAEDSGWEFDRQWMPWSDRVSVETVGPEKFFGEREVLGRREQQPGVLVFRKRLLPQPQAVGKSVDQILLIFLVAETPLTVNVTQFNNALNQAAVLTEPKTGIDILGPTFSGSFRSITRLLQQHWATRSRHLRMESGTATSVPYAKYLRDALKGTVDFHSAVQDSGSMIELLIERLGQFHTDPSHTAILVEDESGFGHTISERLQNRDAVLTIRFPREISAVRNAYQEAVQSAPDAKPEGANKQQSLSFSLRDPQSGEDSLPIFAKAHMPLAQSAVLNEIATTLKRDHIDLAEIIATNVLDTLFLIRVLRTACPDIRLIVPTADLLFVQAEIEEPMTGTLVMANYPLFWPNQKWTSRVGRQSDRVVFPDSNSQGVYNAGRILLRDSHGDPEAADRPLAEYISPFAEKGSMAHPPIWLLEITGSGLWPVRVLDQGQGASDWFQNVLVRGTLPGLGAEPPSRVWRNLALGVALLSMLFTGAVYAAQRLSTRTLYIFALPVQDPTASIRAVYLLTVAACIFAIQTFFVVPYVWFSKPSEMLSFDPLMPALLLGYGALFSIIALVITRIRGRAPRLIASVALLTTIAVCAAFIASCMIPADGVGILFVFRSLHPTGGVSPVIPISLLVLGSGFFAWAHLKRTVFAVERKPILPSKHFEKFAPTCLDLAEHALNRSLEDFFPERTPALAGAVVLGLLLLLIKPEDFLFVIEPTPYRLLLLTMFVFVVVFVLGTALRFLLAWTRLRTLLTRIDRLRLAGAFRRLPREFSGEPIWQQQIRFRSYSTMTRGMECLDVLASMDEGTLQANGVDRCTLLEQRFNMRSALDAIFTAEAAGKSETFQETLCARFAADAAAGYLTSAVLVPAWKNGVVDPDKDDDALEESASSLVSKRAEDPVYRLAAEFVSLRFASYIRYALLQLRNLLGFVSVGFAFLAATLLTYPFQAPQTIRWFLTALFLAISAPAITVLVQMSRNPVLRRLASAKSRGVDGGLLRKLLQFGALPLIGVLSAQFPTISKWLGSWIQPTLEALR